LKTNSRRVVISRPRARAARFLLSLALASPLVLVSSLALVAPPVIAAAPGVASPAASVPARTRSQEMQDDVQLRSYAPPASGRLVVEPSERGGRARLTVLSLPDPQTVSPYAQTYVVWAVSGGRVVRMGELRRDRGGNGGLAFDRPAEFETYGVVVTAERSAEADKPGAPVLATRTDAARTRFPPVTPPTAGPAGPSRPAMAERPMRPDRPLPRPRVSGGADFYTEVDDALEASGGGRLLTLDGGRHAPGASARARTALSAGRAYVRADFSNVPLPSAVGAAVYVLWAVLPDGRIIYMGSLPGTEDLNRAEVYVRVADFPTADFSLAVTAERRRPASTPSAERVLK
jgi:hypothetical protein